MSELIDRGALKDAVKRYAGEPIKQNDRKCQAICLDMLGTIDAQPTIDAVPVVRCKDCDNWATEFSSGRKSLGNYRCLCQEWSDAEDHRYVYTGENEYCSRGERREG